MVAIRIIIFLHVPGGHQHPAQPVHPFMIHAYPVTLLQHYANVIAAARFMDISQYLVQQFLVIHIKKKTNSLCRAPTGTTRNPIAYGLHDIRNWHQWLVFGTAKVANIAETAKLFD